MEFLRTVVIGWIYGTSYAGKSSSQQFSPDYTDGNWGISAVTDDKYTKQWHQQCVVARATFMDKPAVDLEPLSLDCSALMSRDSSSICCLPDTAWNWKSTRLLSVAYPLCTCLCSSLTMRCEESGEWRNKRIPFLTILIRTLSYFAGIYQVLLTMLETFWFPSWPCYSSKPTICNISWDFTSDVFTVRLTTSNSIGDDLWVCEQVEQHTNRCCESESEREDQAVTGAWAVFWFWFTYNLLVLH